MNSDSVIAINFTVACLYSLVCAGIVFFVWVLLSRQLHQLKPWRAYWAAGLLCATLPFFYWMLPLDVTSINPTPVYEQDFAVATERLIEVGPVVNPREKEAGPASGAIYFYWMIIFMVGLVIKAGLLLRNWHRVLELIASADYIDTVFEQRLRTIVSTIQNHSLQRYLDNHEPRILVSAKVGSPFVVSLPKPVLVLPASSIVDWSDQQLALMLEHELVHLLNRDPFILHAVAWLNVVFWFNPFVIGLGRRLTLALELTCDATVLDTKKHQRQQYLQTLLKVVQAGQGAKASQRVKTNILTPAFGSLFMKSLKTRIQQINNPVRQRGNRFGNAIALGILTFSISVGGFLTQPQVYAATNQDLDNLLEDVRTASPVKQVKKSSRFSLARMDPFTKTKQPHRGDDYAAASGTRVFATADGTIELAGENPAVPIPAGYGLTIKINHGHELSTLYLHLASIAVSPGQQVTKGEFIGKVGTTGNVTGPHVHYEVRLNDKAICPSKDCVDVELPRFRQ